MKSASDASVSPIGASSETVSRASFRRSSTFAGGRSSCLQMLPTRTGGRKPALWNAYTGQWGERHCELTFYCDSGSPPTAPGIQARYRSPAHYDLVAVPREPRRLRAREERPPQP